MSLPSRCTGPGFPSPVTPWRDEGRVLQDPVSDKTRRLRTIRVVWGIPRSGVPGEIRTLQIRKLDMEGRRLVREGRCRSLLKPDRGSHEGRVLVGDHPGGVIPSEVSTGVFGVSATTGLRGVGTGRKDYSPEEDTE